MLILNEGGEVATRGKGGSKRKDLSLKQRTEVVIDPGDRC